MPDAPPKPCRYPGCGRLVYGCPGYCDQHRKQQTSGWAAQGRGSSHERGYGWQWQKLRKSILRRDNGLCQVCLKLGRVTAASHVDHIKPKALGGTDDPVNLQAICKPCHLEKTARESGL